MPQLEVGNMDDVVTKVPAMPAQKKVKVIVSAPENADDKAKEIYSDKDGKFSMAKFGLKITEGPYAGRFVRLSVFTAVKKEVYLGWALKNAGQPMSEQEKAAAWDRRDYLKDLKRFGEAIDLDFASAATEDAYGKELLVDITQKENEGELYNEARNPKHV